MASLSVPRVKASRRMSEVDRGWTGPNELPPPPRAPRGTQTNMQPPPPPPIRRPAAPAMIASTGPARNDATWVVTPLALQIAQEGIV